MDEHQLISALKQLAAELGQTPTRQQFLQYAGKGAYRFETVWAGKDPWSRFVQAAGLVPIKSSRITNEIFKKDIEKHLESYIPKETMPHEPWPKIAILGDLHEPFGSDRVKAAFCSFIGRFKPDYVVQIGDLFDMYSHSKFPRSSNLFTPKEEEKAARQRAEELWKEVHKSHAEAKRIGILGNHDVRPLKRTLESMPSFEHWIEKYFQELMTFDGVEMILDPRQEYIISDIAFLHGYLSKLGSHRDYMLMNAVRGHDHTGGVVFKQIHEKVLWELDVGFAGDFNAKGFDYQNQRRSQWTQGFGAIDELGPRFIPC